MSRPIERRALQGVCEMTKLEEVARAIASMNGDNWQLEE